MNNLPPQNLEAEKCVLASVISDSDLIYDLELDELDFYKQPHQILYKTLKYLKNKGTKIDLLVLRDELSLIKQLEHVGGITYITKLLSTFTISSAVKEHAKKVREAAIRRRLIEANIQNSAMAYDEQVEVESLLAQTQANINNVSSVNFEKDDIQTIVSDLYKVQDEYALKYAEGKRILGISCGFDKIDNIIDGLRPGHVWVVGAFTSTGKTQFTLNIVNAVLGQHEPVSIISLEMSKVDTAARLIGINQGLSSMSVIKGLPNDTQVAKIEQGKLFLHTSSLEIHTSVFELEKIKLTIRKDVFKKQVKVVVLDYMQNIIGTGKEYEVITRAATELQSLARELQITIILVSQISNESEKGQGAGGGFKGSGAMEAVADLAIRLKREKNNEDPEAESVPIEINVIKNRHGLTGRIQDYYLHLKSGLINKNYEPKF